MANAILYTVATTKFDATLKKVQLEKSIIDCSTADGNVVKNIGTSNLMPMTPADKGKTFVVDDTGAWILQVNEGTAVFGQYDELPATGNPAILYYLKADAGSYTRGLYIWNGSNYVSAASTGQTVTVDDDTLEKTIEGVLRVKDGTATTGLSVAKFNTTVIKTSISASASAVDTALPTEKAVATGLDAKIPRDSEGLQVTGMGVTSDQVPFVRFDDGT